MINKTILTRFPWLYILATRSHSSWQNIWKGFIGDNPTKRNIIIGKQNVPIILKEERRRSWCSKISLLTLRLVPNVFSSIDLKDTMFARTLNFPKQRWNTLRCYSRTSIIPSTGISYARSWTCWNQKIPVASRNRATRIKSTTTKKSWERSLKADPHQKFSTSQNVDSIIKISNIK